MQVTELASAIPSPLLDADRAAADPAVAEQRARILVGSPEANALATAGVAIGAALYAAHSGPDRNPAPGVRLGRAADSVQDAAARARAAYTGLPLSDAYLHQFQHAAEHWRQHGRAEALAAGGDEDQADRFALATMRALVRAMEAGQ
ncbi:hypothetical protein [Streptomyces sp. NPDC045251]|uniref:hypothetical protein n=1 Tax=unclassified Streptomyces TaxID=2593676 RepID=UPI0033C9970E